MQQTLYRPDSQQSARFGIPPLTRIEIPLVGDRSSGEYFPQYEGQFAYVESCDLPCELGFVSQDRQQTISMADGSTVSGPFKGIVLKHPNFVSATAAKLVLLVSKESKFSNDLSAPVFRMAMPYNRSAVLGAAGTISYRFPIPAKARYLDRVNCDVHVTMSAAFSTRVHASIFFEQVLPAGTVIPSPPAITANGVAYGTRPSVSHVGPAVLGTLVAATFKYGVSVFEQNIPVPSMANQGVLYLEFGAGNLVSVNSAAGTDFVVNLS